MFLYRSFYIDRAIDHQAIGPTGLDLSSDPKACRVETPVKWDKVCIVPDELHHHHDSSKGGLNVSQL